MITNWPALRNGCLILASVAFGSMPALAQTQEPAGATATASVISSVAITQGAQRASVRVEGEGQPQDQSSENAPRLLDTVEAFVFV